jgi:hypothetical protein
MAKNKNFVELGAVVESKDGGFYIKLKDDVEISINGRKYNNAYINAETPQSKLERLNKLGFISDSDLESRLEGVKPFVKLELTARFKDQ